MPREIELKFEASEAAASRLAKARWLQGLVTAPVKRRRLVSVYFDTRSGALRDAGLALRVRKDGDKTVQTIKRDPKGACGAFAREEWEHEISGKRPDLDRAKDTALAQFKLKKLRRRLRPVFETDVQRVAIPIHYRGSEIEIAIDRGEVRTGRANAPISEIEIEVKNGEPTDTIKLARRIAAEASASYSAMAKSEHGYALSNGDSNPAVFADDVALDARMPAAEAFQAIGLSCLRHFASNRDAVAEGDAEAVHQMRVGLRRLRAALSFFKELLANAETETIKRKLKWLTGELGPARDLDVFVEDSIGALEQEGPKISELQTLKSDLQNRRRAGFERAKASVGSDRYRRLVLNTALWLAGGNWLATRDPLLAARRAAPVEDFAARELTRRTGKIARTAKKLDSLDTQRRHKLRIAIKKLRYASGFFAGVFDGGKAKRRRKRLGTLLKDLQSALGKLNDIRVHDQMAQDFARPTPRGRKKTQKAFAFGLLTGKEHAEAKALVSTARKAGQRVSEAKPFWT